MPIPFVKYHGAGNDFVLIDLRHFPPIPDPSSLAQSICQRRTGIGADGLLLLLSSTVADYRMRIFNADGSEPSMCGNGIRCVIDYLQKQESLFGELTIETLHGVLKGRRQGEKIAVNLGPPTITHWPIELPEGSVYAVHTGVPHAVICVNELNNLDVVQLGRKIRFDPRFAPAGVNVNFLCIQHDQLSLRTYERGVEAETHACGTGAAAAAFFAFKQLQLPPPISITTRTDQLHFLFPKSPHGDTEIEMLGSATEVFSGTYK